MKHQILQTVEGSGDSGRDALETLAPSTTECSDQPSISRRAVVNHILSSAVIASTAALVSPVAAATRPTTLQALADKFGEEAAGIDPSIKRIYLGYDELMDGPRDNRVMQVFIEREHQPFLRPAVAAVVPDADLFDAFADWAYASRAHEASSEDEGNSYDEVRSAERRLLSFSAVTARGMALQVLVYTGYGAFELGDCSPSDGWPAMSIMDRLYAAIAADDRAMLGDEQGPAQKADRQEGPDAELFDLAYQWRNAMEEWNNCGWEPIEDHPAGERASQLEERMDQIEALTLRGLAVKILALTSFGDFSIESNSAIRDAMRLTGFTRWTDRAGAFGGDDET